MGDCDWSLDFLCVFIFFFKQKTAYEMRISDWGSDVCSSDLWNMMRANCLWTGLLLLGLGTGQAHASGCSFDSPSTTGTYSVSVPTTLVNDPSARPEERRVGKESVSTCSS